MELQARSEKSFTSSAVPSTSSGAKSGEDLHLKMQEVLSQVATVKAKHQAGKVSNGTTNANKDPRRHNVPSTSSAPDPHSQHPSQHSHNPGHQQDPHCGQSGAATWKRMPNPIGWDARRTLFRVHGICKEVPEHNVASVRDPRIQKYRSNVMMDLPVPYFLIDDDYTAVPTNREFSITGLNDNVDEKFLRNLCRGDSGPTEVVVYHHPITNRHLGIALMDFNTQAESAAFIEKYNGKTIMGSIVQCFFDPLAYKISKLFKEKTGGNFPSLPARYVHLSSVRTIWRIRQMLQKFYGERDEAELPKTSNKVDDNEVIVLDDDEKAEKSPSTPPYDRIPVATPSPTKNILKTTIANQNPTSVTPISGSPNALTSKNAPSDSISTSTFGSAKPSTYDSTVPTPSTPFFTPMASTSCGAFAYGKTPPPPPLPNLPPIVRAQSHGQFLVNDTKLPIVVPPPPPPVMQKVKLDHSKNENFHNDDARSTPTYSTSSQEDSPPPNRKTSKKHTTDPHGKRTSRFNKVEPEAISVSGSDSDTPAVKPSNKQNKSSKKKSSSRASTRSDHSRSDRRRYRWSSDSTESSTGSKMSQSPSPPPRSGKEKRKKIDHKRSNLVSSDKLDSIQLPPSPPPPPPPPAQLQGYQTPQRSGASQIACRSPIVQSPAITSTCSPTAMGVRSHGNSIPPPALINPPTPVGLTPKPSSQQEKSPSTSNSSQTTPKKSGLEERLNQLFFKAQNQKSVSQANVKSEDVQVKTASAGDKIHNSRDAGKTLRNSQRPENSFTVQPSTNKIPSLLDLPILRAMKQEIVRDQPQQPPEPKEMTEDDRIAKERQEKIHKCMDVSKRARTLIHRELLICVQNDIKRRLEQEAFKLLDEQWNAMLEEKKRQEKEIELEVKIIGSTAPSNKENSLLSTLFPSFESATNAEESMLPNESIFGIPYTVRMANLPSFKKKKPIEPKRQSSNSSVFSRARLQKNTLDRKRKIGEDEVSEHRDSKRPKHDARYRSPSQIRENKSKKAHNRHRRRSISSSSQSRSRSASSIRSQSQVKHVDKFDSPMAMSLVTSADEAEPISESEDENEQVKTEKEIEQEIERSIMQRKRAILDICLKESRHAEEAGDSSPLASSITPCSSVHGDTIESPGTPKPMAIATIEIDVENLEYGQVSADSKPATPSDAKPVGPKSKMKVQSNRELAALLGPDFVVPCQVTTKKEPKLWAKRSEEEEERLVYEFQKVGICQEDCAYIKLIYNSTKFREIVPEELRSKLPWVQPNFVPPPEELPTPLKRDNCEFYYNDPELEGVVPHKTGCARTEGYYKIEKQRKRLMRRHDDCSNRTIISTQDETAIRHMTQASKDERAMNRRLLTWIGDNSLLRVNQLKYRSKMIKFARSRIHGWGLYALEKIAQEEMIIEYVGEKVRPTVADEREKSYERRGMGSSYMFRIDGDAVIDATKMGNHGRFINHSCNPNCTARVVTVDGDKRIVIYSKRLITKGEEITYDYKFAREEEASKIECLCGARCCQKYLN